MSSSVKKVAVLVGGWSSEREVSLRSGGNVARCLAGMEYEVVEIDVKKDLRYFTDILYAAAPDFVFNMLHGTGGEDGVMQGVLDMYGVPYSSSGVLSSAISFDKSICKKLARFSGVRVADWVDITSDELANVNLPGGRQMPYPFVVKPVMNGSSVGVSLIFNEDDLIKVKSSNWNFGRDVMLEQYIPGREFTVMILNGEVIGMVEITCKSTFYDYSSKYDVGGSTHLMEFDLPESMRQEMYDMTKTVHDVCRCRDVARADIRYDGEHAYFLEINTQPGMTDQSLIPDIARFNGISMEALLQRMIDAACA
ncbi:MAG: D-alanine--D-alanine ligase [Holosporales bacterium]|nr:D-alanine--D-alanine ligase [Holosporales bacterium]